MPETENELLDIVGRRLVNEFADRFSEHLFDLFNGSQYSLEPWYQLKYGALSSLTESQRRAVANLLQEAVPAAMHAFLDILENDKFREAREFGKLSLSVVDSLGVQRDVALASDGLPGEIYTNLGWLERFSKKIY